MKKIILLVLSFSLSITLLIPNTHAYTLSNTAVTYYNQTTASIGQADLLDINSDMIEYMYYDLGNNYVYSNSPIRIVFSNIITNQILPAISPPSTNAKFEISLYDSNNTLLGSNITYYNTSHSLSYFETNFISNTSSSTVEYIVIKISNLSSYNELRAHESLQGAIIARGDVMVINQPVNDVSYGNGWNDAMSSKVTQIWSLWGNIFDTFMSVFNVFSIKLMGDITIGHLAMVPLVLGLIGFIYALGGKRGR